MFLDETVCWVNRCIYGGGLVCNSCYFGITANLAIESASRINILACLLNDISHEFWVAPFYVSILNNIDEGLVNIGLEVLNLVVCIDVLASPLDNYTDSIDSIRIREMFIGYPISWAS